MGRFRSLVLLVLAAAILGAFAARVAGPRKAASPVDEWGDEPAALNEITTAVDRMSRSAALPSGPGASPCPSPRERSLQQGLLPASVFKRRAGSEKVLFEQIFTAVGSERVRFRALNRRDGSFLFDDEKGWLKFNGSRFVTVREDEVPGDVRLAAPVVTHPLTGKTRAFGPGDR